MGDRAPEIIKNMLFQNGNIGIVSLNSSSRLFVFQILKGAKAPGPPLGHASVNHKVIF